jgi:hypothetical protein
MRCRRGIFALWLLGACGVATPAVPRIDRLAPAAAPAGAALDILGDGLCGQDPADVGGDDTCALALDGFVSFGAVPGIGRRDAAIARWTRTRVTVTVPALAVGATRVTVTVAGRPSDAADFEVAR